MRLDWRGLKSLLFWFSFPFFIFSYVHTIHFDIQFAATSTALVFLCFLALVHR
jgi:predicted permease